MEKKETKRYPNVPWDTDTDLDSLRERIIFLAEDLAPSRGKYEYLETYTAISAARWQNLFLRRLTPSVEMLLVILRMQPQYTYWLLWGIDPPTTIDDRVAPMKQESPSQTRWNHFVKIQEHLAEKQRRLDEVRQLKEGFEQKRQKSGVIKKKE